MDVVVGLDVGGTQSRALVTTLAGVEVGRGSARGGNPVTLPLSEAVRQVAQATREALGQVRGARVRAAVMGIAGTSAFDRAEVAGEFQGAFKGAGVDCPVEVVGDVVVAFAAGTGEPSGTVLSVGTGAVAATILEGRMTDTRDGLGWLLGDLGSGFWLGRAAATATAHALYRRESGLLIQLVQQAVLGREGTGDDLVSAVHAQQPRELNRLAPLVSEAAEQGDELALSIVDEAADHLLATVASLRRPEETTPIVLSGSVLKSSRMVRDAVVERLTRHWSSVVLAGPGESGAARLAAASLKGNG